jgi:hypothetical protein
MNKLNILDIVDLYKYLEDSLIRVLPEKQYKLHMNKLDKMIGLFYGSIIGLLSGAPTQPLGPKSAREAYNNKIPFAKIKDSEAFNDPIIGQFLYNMKELKESGWDSNKYRSLDMYKRCVCNSSTLKVESADSFKELIKTHSSPQSYNLFSEDFYIRVPVCALFGEESIEVLISKIMQTHTSP